MFTRRAFVFCATIVLLGAGVLIGGTPVCAQEDSTTVPQGGPARGKTQAELEDQFAQMLSGATLEGSFTNTAGGDGDRLRRDKYTLGEVKKLEGKLWMIQARIQYRDSEAVMVPLPLPVEWAGDTPVIVVDNFTIPGMGTFSARVMFFDDHYAGYWKHGERGGNMFGVVRRAGAVKEKAEK
jgi:hypothetical protein